jgi:hypothetical protein
LLPSSPPGEAGGAAIAGEGGRQRAAAGGAVLGLGAAGTEGTWRDGPGYMAACWRHGLVCVLVRRWA